MWACGEVPASLFWVSWWWEERGGVLRSPSLADLCCSSMCYWSLGKWQTDLITHNKTRVCKAIWSLVEFLWEGTACVCECVEEGLGGPGWLLKWGVLKGVLFLHISCLHFFTLCTIAFARIKQWGIFTPEIHCCIFVLWLQGENVYKHQNLGSDDGIQPHNYLVFFRFVPFFFLIVVSNA